MCEGGEGGGGGKGTIGHFRGDIRQMRMTPRYNQE